MTLLEQLVKRKILRKEQATSLEFEVKSSGKREEEVILDKGIVSEGFLFGLKSENLKIPLKDVSVEDVSLKILELIPEDAARYYKMVPLAKKDSLLEVGMVYPEDLKARESLQFLSRRNKSAYQIFLITPSTFNKLLRQYRTLKREVTRALEELETELKAEKVKIKPIKTAEFEKLAEEAPIIKVVAVILRHAVEGKASDIHIEPTRKKTRIRFRVDGVLYSSIFLPLRIQAAIVARIKILSNLKIDETRVPQDGRFSTRINERDIDFRVSTFPTAFGEKVAIRVLDPTEIKKNFDELGIERKNYETIQTALKKPYGLILATGPTGCGKTTTLYALLNRLNKEDVNIVTLEDPVEYFIEGINQSQIRPEIGYSFAQGLREVLRQDPDIIMVGEVRDEETASLVTHAALTGHIVLSTLHTNNAIGVVPRLIDMGVRPFLISPSLSIAIAQRLVRKLCPYCKQKVKPKKKVKDIILEEIEAFPQSVKKKVKIPSPLYIYEAKGCKKCNFKGFKGRIGIFEVLAMTSELSEIILGEPEEKNIRQEAYRQGMITMKQDGILKVLDGVTTIEEVLREAEAK